MKKPETHLLSICAAAALGVAVATLRHWHRQGRLPPSIRTLGGHRHYESDVLRAASGAAHSPASKAGLQCVLLDIPHERVSRLRHRRVEDRSRARDQPNGSTTANVTKCETPATPGKHTPHSVLPIYIHSRMYVKLPRTTDPLLA